MTDNSNADALASVAHVSSIAKPGSALSPQNELRPPTSRIWLPVMRLPNEFPYCADPLPATTMPAKEMPTVLTGCQMSEMCRCQLDRRIVLRHPPSSP